MKLKDGFILREIAGNYMVVPLGSQVSTFSSVIKLNETGAFLWSLLESEVSFETLVSKMLSEYDIDEKNAQSGVENFIHKLADADLLDNNL